MHGPDGYQLRELRAARARQLQVSDHGSEDHQPKAVDRIVEVQHKMHQNGSPSAPLQHRSAALAEDHSQFTRDAETHQEMPSEIGAMSGCSSRRHQAPVAGWAKDYAVASASSGKSKPSAATALLASGLRKAVTTSPTPSSSSTAMSSQRRVSFDGERDEKGATFVSESVEKAGKKKSRSSRPDETKEERRQRHRERKEACELQAIEDLKKSPQIARLKRAVQKDVKALQYFLDALTDSNPELMNLIASRREEFMSMVLEDGEPSSDSKATAPPVVEEISQQNMDGPISPVEGEPAKQGADETSTKVEASPQPGETQNQSSTTSSHPLAQMYSPYSCAICKSTKNLLVCSACKSAQFCCREHQRQFWPRHQKVCKFIAACQGGLLKEVSGKPWSTEALPKILDVWCRDKKREPELHEYDQLLHLPRCRVCGKLPAAVICEASNAVGYCSEACRSSDTEWRHSWQSQQVMLTMAVAGVMHKAGGGLPVKMRNPDCTLTQSIFEEGWQEYIKAVGLEDASGTDFMKLNPIAQQVIVDQLSYPMVLLEALHLAGEDMEKLCTHRTEIEVHLFNPEAGAMADMEKFEALLHHAGPQVKTLRLRLIGEQVPVRRDQDHQELNFTPRLQERCRQEGKRMFVDIHRVSCGKWLDEQATLNHTPPVFRAAFSPALGRFPVGDELDAWAAVLERLAALSDGIPMVLTEKLMCALQEDVKRTEKYGIQTLLQPVTSSFASPLALVDDISSKEDNPCGLLVWNAAAAVVAAQPLSSGRESSSSLEKEVQSIVASMDVNLHITQAEEIGAHANATASGDLAGNRALGVTCQQQSNVQHAGVLHESAGDIVFSLPGPLRFDGSSFEDFEHSADTNPCASFSIELEVQCDAGGRGYRSPLTSRDDPPAGYVFYIDGEDRWNFWVADAKTKYWKGILGPAVAFGKWMKLAGIIDIEAQEITLYVDGKCVGREVGITYIRNEHRPLRIGAGRSESQQPRFWFSGQVRDVVIRSRTRLCDKGSKGCD